MKYGKTIFLWAFIALAQVNATLMAMGSKPADPNAPQAPWYIQMFPLIFMVAVFYFFLLRPQSKQRKERQRMLDALKKGDQIVTQGGIIGSVVNINNGTVEVKISDETKVKILRSAVTEILTQNQNAEVKEAQVIS